MYFNHLWMRISVSPSIFPYFINPCYIGVAQYYIHLAIVKHLLLWISEKKMLHCQKNFADSLILLTLITVKCWVKICWCKRFTSFGFELWSIVHLIFSSNMFQIIDGDFTVVDTSMWYVPAHQHSKWRWEALLLPSFHMCGGHREHPACVQWLPWHHPAHAPAPVWAVVMSWQ